MPEAPKYSLPEIERRWLVDLAKVDLSAATCREIEDLYLDGSGLRLRKISGDQQPTFKLGKKYGKSTPLAVGLRGLTMSRRGPRLARRAIGVWAIATLAAVRTSVYA